MKIVTMKVVFDGIYFWGQGFPSHEKSRKWNEFWDSKDANSIFWHSFKYDEGIGTTRYLVCTSGMIYLHPMGFDLLYKKLGASYDYNKNGEKVETFMEIDELKEICQKCAEYCGGTVKFEEPKIFEINS